jgi:hypothetical protein
MKDPSVIFYQGRWHLFCTIRGQNRSHQIEYLTFGDWKGTDKAKRHLLKMHSGYFCAPQVFYFRPHRKWYLICQASDESWEPKYAAAYATTTNITETPRAPGAFDCIRRGRRLRLKETGDGQDDAPLRRRPGRSP